ncbi:hypothetical protein BJX99DRAFT_249205 [Aspergillus californicus]
MHHAEHIHDEPAPFTIDLLRSPPTDTTSRSPGPGPLCPSIYRTRKDRLVPVQSNEPDFLSAELCVDRLDKIHRFLWIAGLPKPPRPLHYQLVLQREITICEKMDMHLVWGSGRIFLKPIPLYLLSKEFWGRNLVCREGCECRFNTSSAGPRQIQRSIAVGFLLTYAALLTYESDFVIAKERGLLPGSLTSNDTNPTTKWNEWQQLVRELLASSSSSSSFSSPPSPSAVYKPIHRRFRHGELRLGRLNAIYILTGKGRLYMNQWPTYASFLRDQLSWLATATIYIALVLTAMQVGLATDRLRGNEVYMSAAYGASVFAILGPLVMCGALFFVLLVFFVKNWRFQSFTWRGLAGRIKEGGGRGNA